MRQAAARNAFAHVRPRDPRQATGRRLRPRACGPAGRPGSRGSTFSGAAWLARHCRYVFRVSAYSLPRCRSGRSAAGRVPIRPVHQVHHPTAAHTAVRPSSVCSSAARLSAVCGLPIGVRCPPRSAATRSRPTPRPAPPLSVAGRPPSHGHAQRSPSGHRPPAARPPSARPSARRPSARPLVGPPARWPARRPIRSPARCPLVRGQRKPTTCSVTARPTTGPTAADPAAIGGPVRAEWASARCGCGGAGSGVTVGRGRVTACGIRAGRSSVCRARGASAWPAVPVRGASGRTTTRPTSRRTAR